MSTKSTLACWREKNLHFHLYTEAGCSDTVYLDLHTGDERQYRGQSIDIPIAVWEAIRTKTIWQNDLVGKTAADLREIAIKYVEKREHDFHECVGTRMKAGDSVEQAMKQCGLIKFFGCMGYGSGDEPKRTQIRKGLASLRKERARQEKIQKQIDAMKAKNADYPGVFLVKLKKGRKKNG